MKNFNHYLYDLEKLISYKKDEGGYFSNTLSCFWEQDKLSSCKRIYRSESYTESYTITFDYDGISCPKGCIHPIFITLSYSDDSGWVNFTEKEMFVFAHPELFGVQTTLLPTSITYDDDNYSFNYQYEFDKNGYVSKIIVITEEFEHYETFTLTWE